MEVLTLAITPRTHPPMPSSPIRVVPAPGERGAELMELLAQVPDPRDPRGVRYPLAGILAVAVLTGARSFAAIGGCAGDLSGPELARLGIEAAPQESTLRKLFARLDADVLDRLVGSFLWTRTRVIDGRRVIAVDGKTVRGARGRSGAARATPHLAAAFDHTAGAVLGQVAVTAKSNEIPAVRTLLASFDLTHTMVTMDAMHA